MKKFVGLSLLMGLIFGVNSVLFAQGGQNPPPPPREGEKMGKRGGPDGPGWMRGKHFGMRRGNEGHGRMGGMHGGFGINDQEIAKLNLTDAQKVKLYDFRKKMADEREAMRKNMRPGEGQKPEINREEMRQLMNAKSLGTLTAEQKAKLDQIEANRKQMMEKRKTEMEAMKKKMEQNHQEFLNIFTLEQRKQLEQMRNERAKEMQERMKQMRERRPGGPQGPKPPTNPNE